MIDTTIGQFSWKPQMSKKLKVVPAWLGLSEDRTKVFDIPAKSKIVRRIFEDAAAGVGAYAIARRLTEEQVPTMGRSKIWQPSSIDNLIRNPAVLGHFQPKLYRRGTSMIAGDLIPDYYPRIIEDALFEAAQSKRAPDSPSRKGRKGAGFTNIFGTRLRCAYCTGRTKSLNNNSKKYVICLRRHRKLNCRGSVWPYDLIEASFLKFLASQQYSGSAAFSELEKTAERFDEDSYRMRSLFCTQVEAAGITILLATKGCDPRGFIFPEGANGSQDSPCMIVEAEEIWTIFFG